MQARGPLLLINADRDTRILFTKLSRRWPDVKLLVAEGGTAGMHMALARRPRGVVVDAALRDIDSARLIAALRRHPTLRGTPIVAIGGDLPTEEHRMLKAGADVYLSRPLDLARVDRVVPGLLEVAALR